MAASFRLNGDGTVTVTFAYTAVTVKAQETVNQAAAHVYHVYPILDESGEIVPFENLTNQQKLNILDRHILRVILDAARANLVNEATEAARQAALGDDSVDLGD